MEDDGGMILTGKTEELGEKPVPVLLCHHKPRTRTKQSYHSKVGLDRQKPAVTTDFITKLYRQQAEVIQNHVNPNVHNIGQGEAQHRKYKRLKLGSGQAYDRSSDQLSS
jgi:hypothetical protein